MNPFAAENVRLALTEEEEGLRPVYELLEGYSFPVPGRAGRTVEFPRGERTDGGSIPTPFQLIIPPMRKWYRVPFLRHDLKYAVQGGRRVFVSNPSATAEYTRTPISRLRADWELWCDLIEGEVRHRWKDMELAPTFWKVVRFPVMLVWRSALASVMLLLLLAFGFVAWQRKSSAKNTRFAQTEDAQ